MKKLILLLFSIPCVLEAQILPNLFSPFRQPDHWFAIDTNLYYQGNMQIKEYSVDKDGFDNLQNIYDWQSQNGRFIKTGNTFVNATTGFNYYESQFEYQNGRPFQHYTFRRLINQTLLEPTGKDSLVEISGNFQYVYRVTGNQNPGYHTEYEYDTIFGLKASYIRDIPADFVFAGTYEAISFYKPGLPAIVNGYSDSQDKRALGNIRINSYDSLDRIFQSVDSTVFFGELRYLGTQRIVYHQNTRRIDSIIQDQPLYNTYQVYHVFYDASNKVSQINLYRQTQTEPYRLVRRFDFINPASGILDQTNTKLAVTLFPNPAFDRLNFKSEKPIEAVEIYDLTGALVLKQNAIEKESLSINNLTPGIYFIKLSNEQGSSCQRLVISQ